MKKTMPAIERKPPKKSMRDNLAVRKAGRVDFRWREVEDGCHNKADERPDSADEANIPPR